MKRPEAMSLLKSTFQEGFPDRQLPEEEEALLGADATLDSMDLVNFVADVEEALEERGQSIVLADERALSRSRSPFRSLAALADYLVEVT